MSDLAASARRIGEAVRFAIATCGHPVIAAERAALAELTAAVEIAEAAHTARGLAVAEAVEAERVRVNKDWLTWLQSFEPKGETP